MLSAHPLRDGVVVTDSLFLRLLDADHEPVLPTQEYVGNLKSIDQSIVDAVSTVADAAIPFVAEKTTSCHMTDADTKEAYKERAVVIVMMLLITGPGLIIR